MKLLRNKKYLNLSLVAALTTSTLVLFQNCSNYSGKISLDDVDQLKSSATEGDGNITEGDNVTVHIDPIDSHSDMSSVSPPITSDMGSAIGATSGDGLSASDMASTITQPGESLPIAQPGESLPITPGGGGMVSDPSGGVSLNPGTTVGMGPSTGGPSTGGPSTGGPSTGGPSTGPATDNEVINPIAEDIPPSTVVILPHPGLPVFDEKPECFSSATDSSAGDAEYTTNVVSSDGEIVVSSDQRPVVTSDNQVVVYGAGSRGSSTVTTSCTGSSCGQSGSTNMNCSFFAKNLDKKKVLQLSSSHNNLSIVANKCGVKTIIYDGAETITLNSVKSNDISICGNIIIKNLEARGGVELTNVQVNFASIKGNISSYKLDNGFKVLVSSKQAGLFARTCSVNNKYEIK